MSLIPYNMPTKHQSNPNPNKHQTQIQQFFKEQNTCNNLPNDICLQHSNTDLFKCQKWGRFDTVVFTIFLPRSLLRKTVARQRFA